MTTTPRTTAKLLTAREVSELLGIHPRSVWRLASAGDLPKPIRLGQRVVRWRERDIIEAIERAVTHV